MWLYEQIINQDPVVRQVKGGPGSGNWGHAGVKGSRGGSAPKSGMGSAMSLASGPTARIRQLEKQADALFDHKKTRDQYYVSTVDMKTNKLGWKQVRGVPVKIQGFEDVDLFLHKEGHGWAVSDARSGGKISADLDQAQAMERAKRTLQKIGKEDFKKTAKKIVLQAARQRPNEKVPRSPRYGGPLSKVINRPKGMRDT